MLGTAPACLFPSQSQWRFLDSCGAQMIVGYEGRVCQHQHGHTALASIAPERMVHLRAAAGDASRADSRCPAQGHTRGVTTDGQHPYCTSPPSPIFASSRLSHILCCVLATRHPGASHRHPTSCTGGIRPITWKARRERERSSSEQSWGQCR